MDLDKQSIILYEKMQTIMCLCTKINSDTKMFAYIGYPKITDDINVIIRTDKAARNAKVYIINLSTTDNIIFSKRIDEAIQVLENIYNKGAIL